MSHTSIEKRGSQPGAFLPTKKKRKSKWIWIASAVMVLAVILLFSGGRKGRAGNVFVDLSDTTVLADTDLRSTISANGIVESAESTAVYSTLAYPVKAVHVEVGDRVEAGSLLAELDDQNILDQISSQEISRNTAAASSASQVKAAQDNYDNFKYGLDNGLNATLNNAQIQADNAYSAYEQALLAYDRHLDSLQEDENTALISAEASLRSAETALDAAQQTYDALAETARETETAYWQAKQELEQVQLQIDQLTQQKDALVQTDPEAADEIARLDAEILQRKTELLPLTISFELAQQEYTSVQSQLSSAESALDQAADLYETQTAAYRAAVTGADQLLADYQTNVDTAWKAYEDALTALETAEKSVQDQLQTYENTLSSAKNNGSTASVDESIRQLRVSLEDTKITAPASGTVTAVYAEVGAAGSGLLFVIEDTEHLIVNTSVKSYDMGSVHTGIPVVITSDSTGDAEFDGILSRLAPAANKNMQGVTDTTTDAQFAAEVEVCATDTGLLIGMEAQLDFVLGEASQVLTVPYSAVYKNQQNQTCVITLTQQEDETYLLQETAVQTGMSDDLDIVISGSEIREGVRVLNDPDAYRQYIGKNLPEGIASTNPFLYPMGG